MNRNNLVSVLTEEVYDLSELVLKNRLVRALDEGAARYPIFRELRFAARIELEVLLDAIALDPAWRAQRIHSETAILDGDGIFVAAYGSRKADYCSRRFYIWAADVTRVEEAKQNLLAKAGSTRITEPTFSIDWHFCTSDGHLQNAPIHVRTLTSAEAQALAEEIAAGDAEKLTRASLAFAGEEGRKRSLAEIYRALR